MRLTHVFVDSFPEPLEEGKLYVSMHYSSVAHLCAGGCGNEVVTPIRKRGWKLTFDGESITLSPSVGNHNLPCRSHYLIRENEIHWAGTLSWEEILASRVVNQQGGASPDTLDALGDLGSDELMPTKNEGQEKQVLPAGESKQPLRRHRWWKRLLFWKQFHES